MTRAFPQSLEAERALLGGLLLDNGQIAAMAEIVRADDFYSTAHANIFELLVEADNRSEKLDILGLADLLMANERAEEYGGLAYATSLPEHVPTTENLSYYAGLIRNSAVKRDALKVSAELSEKIYRGDESLQELLTSAEDQLASITQEAAKSGPEPIGQIIDHEWQRLEQIASHPGEVTGVPTGFIDLDRTLAGLQPGDLVILAARPAMGKTALALNIAQNASIRAAAGALIFSLEMTKGQLSMRMMCAEARVDFSRARTGRLDREDWPRLEAASELLYHAPIWIDDTPALSIPQMRSRARQLRAKHESLRLILVDYLQLATGVHTRGGSREQEISGISRGLKALAKELNVPVVALSQLNRGVESRADKRPLISDLRESGAIEQDADVVMFIYRDDYYNPDSPTPGVAELIVAKQRNGPTGTVKLAFQGRYTRFDNLVGDERRGPNV